MDRQTHKQSLYNKPSLEQVNIPSCPTERHHCNTYSSRSTVLRVSVFAVDEQAAGSPLRMPEDLQAGSDVIDNESKRSMGLLRLGRSRWGAETSKRKMGLLRLGRGDPEALSSSVEDKRSMQLLRLGRKRDDAVGPDDMAGQMRQRCVVSFTRV